MTKKVLIISTSHSDKGNTGEKTGLWLEELAAPYLIFKEQGYDVTIASIKGGNISLDPNSLQGDFYTEAAKQFAENEETAKLIKESVALESVEDEYDAIYLPGGHGAVWDFPGNKKLASLLTSAYASGKIVSSVCHGPAGLLDPKDGDKPLVSGKKVAGFSDSEEEAVGGTNIVPFLLEQKLKELGALYTKNSNDWGEYAVVDGRLVTGQNPGSSALVAKHVVALLNL